MTRHPTKAPSAVQLLRAIHVLHEAWRTSDLPRVLGCSLSTCNRLLAELREGETADLVYRILGERLHTEVRGPERWHRLSAAMPSRRSLEKAILK